MYVHLRRELTCNNFREQRKGFKPTNRLLREMVRFRKKRERGVAPPGYSGNVITENPMGVGRTEEGLERGLEVPFVSRDVQQQESCVSCIG